MATSSAWTRLDGGIHVRQSAAFQMNSVALLHAEQTVLVDPGILASELDDLARVVADTDPAAVMLVFTHAHWDHVIGRPWWPKAQTLAHDHFAAEVKRDAARILDEIRGLAAKHAESWERGFTPFRPDHAVSGLRFLKLGPWRLVIRDAPGHSTSQISIHLPDHGVLIAADMLSDIEPPMLDGPCRPYLETLRGLRPLAEGGAITTLIPGHGSIARGKDAVLARLRGDLDYLEKLESGVIQAMGEGLDLAATRERLRGLGYPTRGANDAGLDEHLENVDFAYRGVAKAPA
ncbi:MAG TPA: MBL fold metallo-hydrolase [Candidatus Eisenbacteria bacterium]|nr:MBL fold metallo-hydrolase [Candidatus Eisenbacteria bacterium]